MSGGKDTRGAKLSVLFLCTGNSCRSQMAEGWTRKLWGELIAPDSAGTEAHGLDPLAVEVMAEAGVDISRQRSKTVADLGQRQFDAVVTVCDQARQRCPVLPGDTRRVHVSFDDPPWLARSAGTQEEAMAHYRRVRDEIRVCVERLPDLLG
jgi:arsenate reductase